MNKLDMESKDIVNENIEKISKIFPNVIVESERGKSIDFELLKQELSKEIIEGNKEKYQLTWPGKKEAIVNANTPTNKTLRLIKEKSVDFENTKNIYIEGDNLEVLKTLQESYINKIKCIYIDPPYNTGNDFIYKDNYYVPEQYELKMSGQIDEYNNKLITNGQGNGKYHSDWLTMIYPRVKLARNLLTDDGIIFISIDEKEIDNLKKVCDEIFGERNYLETFHIKVRYENKSLNEDSDFQPVMEYILLYAKNKDSFIPSKPFEEYDLSKFVWSFEELTEGETINVGNKTVTIFKKGEWKIKKHDEEKIGLLKETWASGSIVKQSGTAAEFLSKYLIDRKDIDGLSVLYKIYNMGEDGLGYRYVTGPTKPDAIRGKFYSGVPLERITEIEQGTSLKYKPIVNFYDYSGDFGNIRKEGDIAFNSGKKPIKMLQNLFEIVNLKNDDIVLDFFSGSASTAHAVIQKNAEKNQNIKWILVQIPELINEKEESYRQGFRTICDIGEERIKRSAKKVKEKINANIDYGFRVYKIDSSNMKDVYYLPDEIKQEQLGMFESNIKEDRTAEDLLIQVILDLGLTLDLKIEEKNILNNKIYFVDENSLVACFDDNIDLNIVDEICKCNPLKVVFKDDSFKYDNDKINLQERLKKLLPNTEVSII